MELIRLNLIPTGPMPTCHASQYDKKREIGLVLFNGTRPLLLTDETLELDVRKSDSHIVTIDVPTPEGTNLAVFETTEQMCAVAGSNECELRIKKAGSDIGSLNFIMEIERSPMENGLQSDSEIRNLATQIAEAATPVVQEIAPPIIRDFLADDYYTAEQTNEAIETATEGKADTTYVNTELDKKADKTDTYTKAQVDTIANRKMNSSNPSGTGSIAVGSNMLNAGYNSQTFGKNTKAFNQNTFAAGEGTSANSNNQFVFGRYNQDDWREKYVEIVGNGTNGHSSNARTLDWEGNESIAGDLTFNGSTSLTAEIDRLDDKIDDLPEPMIFKGTLGTGGTIETLPAADAAHEGYTYKVITEGTYAGQAAKIGDTFTCCKPEGAPAFTWVLFSQGDTDTDTWRSIKVNGTEVIGSGISSGAVDFIGSENIEIEYESTGNKIKAKTKNLYTKEEVDDLIEEAVYNLLPSDTESGAIANFETDLALPLKSMEIEVKAQQEAGTPTPASPLPIRGWNAIKLTACKKNLVDIRPFNEFEITSSYSVLMNCVPNTKIRASLIDKDPSIDLTGISFGFVDSKWDKTLPLTTKQYRWIVQMGVPANDKNNTSVYNTDIILTGLIIYPKTEETYNKIMARYNIEFEFETVSNYEPFNGTTEVIELGGTYYGGRLLQDKDGHRRFEVTHKCVDWINSTWSRSNSSGSWANYIFYARFDDMKIASFLQSDIYQLVSGSIGNMDNYKCRTGSSNDYIYVRNDDYTDPAAFKSAMENHQILYELATPYTIDLPDGEPITTFIGTNNIYADSGNTAVEFKESINQKIASLQALLLST